MSGPTPLAANQGNTITVEDLFYNVPTRLRYTVEHVVYPALKKTLVPPAACLTDRSLLQVASLPELYKVFERC